MDGGDFMLHASGFDPLTNMHEYFTQNSLLHSTFIDILRTYDDSQLSPLHFFPSSEIRP